MGIAENIQKVLKFEGLVAPTFTGYNEDGTLNTDVIPEYVDYLHTNGVTGVFVNGTTGESVSLSIPERKSSVEKWVKAARDKFLFIAQIGASCILEAKELAEHAEKTGVDAIAIIPPIYYRPSNDDELVKYLEEVSSAAPNTPLIYYHIPKVTHVNVTLNTFLPRAKKVVRNLCGAKYTSTDLHDLVLCQMKHSEHFKIMLGSDELMLATLPYGINAFIGISFNMFHRVAKEILDNYRTGDLKTALLAQNLLAELVEKALKHGPLVPVMKVSMNALTNISVGEPRTPMCPLSPAEEYALIQDLGKMGFTK